MRNRFFNLGSVLVQFKKKNSDLVRNEFGSVRFKKTRFGSDIIVIYCSCTHVIADITVTVDDMTLPSLTSLTKTTTSK